MTANLVTASRMALLAPLWLFLVQADPASRWMALAAFLLAGLTDVVDGRIARALGQVSAAGALLDLVADRLLTATALIGLIANGALAGPYALAGAVLVGRDLVVASLNEALPGRLAIRVSALEKAKITFQFLAFGLLIAPDAFALGGIGQHDLGRAALAVGAALALATLADYVARAARELRTRG